MKSIVKLKNIDRHDAISTVGKNTIKKVSVKRIFFEAVLKIFKWIMINCLQNIFRFKPQKVSSYVNGNMYSVSCDFDAIPRPTGTEPNLTCLNRHHSRAGRWQFIIWTAQTIRESTWNQYRLYNGMCRSILKVKHRHRKLVSWYGSPPISPRLMLVQAN